MRSRMLAVIWAVVLGLTAILPRESLAQSPRQFPGWGIEYQLPPTWLVAQMPGRMHVLSSQSEAGSIFVVPGLYSEMAEVEKDLDAFATMADLVGEPVEEPTEFSIDGYRAVTTTYDGQTRSLEPVRARMVAVFTPHGTGIVILGLANPEQFPTLSERVQEIAISMKARPPAIDGQTIAALDGVWANYRSGRPPAADAPDEGTRGIDDLFEFDGVGAYAWKSSIYLSAEARGRTDEVPASSRDVDSGTYSVIAGKLVLKGRFGQRVVPMELEGARLRAGQATYFRKP